METKKYKHPHILTVKDDNTNKVITSAYRMTPKGVSNYCNRMYRKYGEHITIEEGHFSDNMNWHLDCTWHA